MPARRARRPSAAASRYSTARACAWPCSDVEEIGISETWSEPGGAAPAPHPQADHVVSLYVLEGELVLTAGDRELRAEAGTWAQMPPGVPHTLSPPGSEPVRFLSMHTPSSGLGAFLRDS